MVIIRDTPIVAPSWQWRHALLSPEAAAAANVGN